MNKNILSGTLFFMFITMSAIPVIAQTQVRTGITVFTSLNILIDMKDKAEKRKAKYLAQPGPDSWDFPAGGAGGGQGVVLDLNEKWRMLLRLEYINGTFSSHYLYHGLAYTINYSENIRFTAGFADIAPMYHLVRGRHLDLYWGIGLGYVFSMGNIRVDNYTYENGEPYPGKWDLEGAAPYTRYFIELTYSFYNHLEFAADLGYRLAEIKDIRYYHTEPPLTLNWNGLVFNTGINIIFN
ncbi:hypothetical protein ACFLQJ_00665 [Calditrichota bacterium]